VLCGPAARAPRDLVVGVRRFADRVERFLVEVGVSSMPLILCSSFSSPASALLSRRQSLPNKRLCPRRWAQPKDG
jgi:hypothetical protein